VGDGAAMGSSSAGRPTAEARPGLRVPSALRVGQLEPVVPDDRPWGETGEAEGLGKAGPACADRAFRNPAGSVGCPPVRLAVASSARRGGGQAKTAAKASRSRS